LDHLLGPAQIAALLVLLQRGFEELYSRRNTRRLIAEGAHEEGRDYYPVVAVTHLAWLASVFFLIPVQAPVSLPIIFVYLALQLLRYWAIGALGQHWTYRIITSDDAPRVLAGPYRYLRHPNYWVTVAEVAVLPAAFGAYALGAIMAAIEFVVLAYKSRLEDAALAARRAKGSRGSLH
jgi:methyltransferase